MNELPFNRCRVLVFGVVCSRSKVCTQSVELSVGDPLEGARHNFALSRTSIPHPSASSSPPVAQP